MRNLLHTDLHLTEDRLEDQKKVLDQIEEAAIRQDIQNIIFFGDGFGRTKEDRRRIPAILLNTFSEHIKKMNEAGITYIIIAGNHDKPDDESKISYFTPIKNDSSRLVIDKESDTLSMDKMLFVPFLPDERLHRLLIKSSKKYPDTEYIFMHAGINGVRTNEHHKHESIITIELLKKFKKLHKVFSGHFHNRTEYHDGLVHYIGNSLQLDQSEGGIDKGFCLFDNTTRDLGFVKTEYPEFITLKLKCNNLGIETAREAVRRHKGDYLRIIFKDKKERLLAVPKEELEGISKCASLNIELDYNDQEDVTDIDLNDGSKNIIESWKDYCSMEKLSMKEKVHGIKIFEGLKK